MHYSITVVDIKLRAFTVVMVSSHSLMNSAPVRPVQDKFKGPNFWKQKPPNPTLHFPQAQLDHRPLSALNTAREPTGNKRGDELSGSFIIGSTGVRNTVKNICAAKTNVMCRCQPTQERTS